MKFMYDNRYRTCGEWPRDEKEVASEFDLAEYYRQNYEDALDEIRNLRYKIEELEAENDLLREDIDKAEDLVYRCI